MLATTFMIGAALGAVFPGVAPGFWALLGLAAVVGGVMRSPLTGVVFSLELTHDYNAMLPLAVAASAAYGVSVLTLLRSVMTEKVARRGVHLSREYSVDPLEVLSVSSSSPRRRGPSFRFQQDASRNWIPACAGMTINLIQRISNSLH